MKNQTQIHGTCGGGLEIHRGRTVQPFRPTVEGRLVLGSAPECDVRLGGAGMPAVHSQVHVDDGGEAWIEAIAAEPELLVNGEPCDTMVLSEGDKIVVGPFAFTWHAVGDKSAAAAAAVGDSDELPLSELLDRLERDMALVAGRDEATRRAAATVVEAALETIYGGVAGSRPVEGDRAALVAKLDELTQRIEANESAHAESVSDLLDTQERLVVQVESLVSRLLGEQSGDDGLRASA
jgi:hypothetical protein